MLGADLRTPGCPRLAADLVDLWVRGRGRVMVRVRVRVKVRVRVRVNLR